MQLHLDESLDVPLYRQIAGGITAEIKSGRLAYGAQLPTVRQLASQLNIARGTIKRAYDDLEARGVISKTRGKGTFVAWQEETIQSRKDRAMAAIDHMLDLMEGMRFSPTEVSIFLDLKMRERLQRETLVTIAAIECCPETQAMLVRSLYDLSGAEVFRKDLHETMAHPEGLEGGLDLAVTSFTHYEQLSPLLGEEKCFGVSMELTPESIASLTRLGKGRLGIFTKSERCAVLAKDAAARYAPSARVVVSKASGDETDLTAFYRNIDMVLVPEGISRLCTRAEEDALRAFSGEHPLAQIAWRADGGSMRYLAQRVRDIQARRKR